MWQNLPFVLSAAILGYLLAMWIYSRTYRIMHRLMFFLVGHIFLGTFYTILAVGYFEVVSINFSELWGIWLIFPSVLVLLVGSALAKWKIDLHLMRARIRSGRIGKNLLESWRIKRRITHYRKGNDKKPMKGLRSRVTIELKKSIGGCGPGRVG